MFNDELLVMLVQEKETLYNTRLPAYKDLKAKAEMWEEIGSTLERTGEDCETRWKQLRARYAKELRFQEATCGSGENMQPRWYLFDTMEFIRPHIVYRRQRSNASKQTQDLSQEISEEHHEPPILIFQDTTPTPTPTERARHRRIRKSTESDADEAFISAANAIREHVAISSSSTLDPASRQFGNLVAEMLSTMPKRIRNKRMNRILSILTEAVDEE